MNKEPEIITIVCDNPDCGARYRLSMDTLRAAQSVMIICRECGEQQRINISGRDEIVIQHIR
jgi:RNase P subunit RPR2